MTPTKTPELPPILKLTAATHQIAAFGVALLVTAVLPKKAR
ncbi:hypothetical protein [Agrobacterium pusense]|nr:hypothetical protein [Agrobacterium pusense]